jgi:hypothetical protein
MPASQNCPHWSRIQAQRSYTCDGAACLALNLGDCYIRNKDLLKKTRGSIAVLSRWYPVSERLLLLLPGPKPRETTVWFIGGATFLLALRLFDLRKRLLFVLAQNNARVDRGCAKSSKLEKVIANGRSTNAR